MSSNTPEVAKLIFRHIYIAQIWQFLQMGWWKVFKAIHILKAEVHSFPTVYGMYPLQIFKPNPSVDTVWTL